MNKRFKKAVAANGIAAMETETIQKNGVSPKDLIMSRRNHAGIFLRAAGNIAVLALLLFTVCPSLAQQRHPAEPEMVKVQGGTFTMGCTSEQGDCDSDEKPVHSVTVSSFQIGKYEVTQAQWKAIMGTTLRQQRDKASPEWSLSGEGDNYPMYYVSWDEAQEFIKRLNKATGKNYRLPTEAEWEYAARGGKLSKGYKYSGSNNIDEVAWYDGNSDEQSHPVGTKKANELGIHDMSGNIEEWCQDWYGEYFASSQTNPKGASNGSGRVFRGGCWDYYAVGCRVAIRGGCSPGYRSYLLGFRVVLP
jgi:formylglycine-generating enzyme required for sulfatase activity